MSEKKSVMWTLYSQLVSPGHQQKLVYESKGVHRTPALSVTGTLCITVMIHLATALNLNFASTDFMYTGMVNNNIEGSMPYS